MSKSSIYEKIEAKGRSEAEKIILQAEEKAAEYIQLSLQETQARIDKLIEDNENRNADILKTKVTEIEQLAKQKSLACKKELINKTFNLACEKLLNLSDELFIKLVIKMIKANTIIGNETLVVSQVEFKRYLKLFSNNQLNDTYYDLTKLNNLLGNNYSLKLSSTTSNTLGGFIIIGEHFDIDNTYPTIMSDLANTLETKVANLLFGSNLV